ncbi:iron complex transport system substrate-binding protein [Paenibacillus cellulosilyticus]|uniref:Iron complex transport system substrate-binding protein n=1 Tax=Paenibacillus cellulosilyticus TaxID=375489 RepID=A0A2V2YUC5_9BACL|nr:ABC transporter substrate-binding protein [Paenibacillus cellulosilyticus]PWW03286.1 iron complex transport system substrate-binding protein [Paenibacillus cellulosilyticus]QKS43764.1 ABC transporter substrate-binding protein [Paenibacillus cellulosilyticus]
MRQHLSLITVIIALVIGCCACGTTSTTSTHADSSSSSLSVTDFTGRSIGFSHTPERIVALGNGEADIIHALGGNLVGRPTSELPASLDGIREVKQIGTAHEVDLEQITLLHPDVVLGNDPMNVKDIPIIEGIGSKMLLTSANSVEEITKQIELFGSMLQKETRAAELVDQINTQLADYKQSVQPNGPKVLLVYGAPGTFMAALPTSLGGNILELAGGTNIAANFPRLQSYPQYAQLSNERIVEANPQHIFIMTHGNADEVKASFLKEMQENAAWNNIDAVKQGHVEILPNDLFGSNPGTRVMEALKLMRDTLFAQ